jgi:ubiquinone/menaquinone biosynthesis C-methylase UbiE
MTNLLNRMRDAVLDDQYAHPTGLVGRWLGERMARQHLPEALWTLSLLDLEPQDRVLELGFGAGQAIALVAAQLTGGQVYGIDISQEMVRAARRRNAGAITAGRVVLRQGEVSDLPFANEQFDKVFSIQTFYFWSDPLRVLAEIARVLKPGGRLVITLSTGTTDSTPASGLERYQALLEEQILPAMRQSGWQIARIEEGPASRQFKTTAVIGVK